MTCRMLSLSGRGPTQTTPTTMDEVSGQIASPSSAVVDEEDSGTLDEPVWTTIKRDVLAILIKCRHVLIPGRSKSLLHDWDLWGPLLLCLALGVLLHAHSHSQDSSEPAIHFVHVFVLVWGGAAVVTINAQLLRGKVSFFQSVCTLGYCLLPLLLALLLSRILLSLGLPTMAVHVTRLVMVVVALCWSVFASLGFLSDYLPTDRKALAVYPILLFYFAIGCLVIAQDSGFL